MRPPPNPIITDNGERKGWAFKMTRFGCRSRQDSRTTYVSTTARGAYDFWARSTTTGRDHAALVGFKDSFVRKEPAP